MSWISWILFGLIAGALAKWIMPGNSREPSGCILTMILGIVGSVVGGWLGSTFLGETINDHWSLKGFLFAVGGAVLVLFIYGKVFGKK